MNMQVFIKSRFDPWRGIIQKILDANHNFMTVDEVFTSCAECRRLFFENGEAFAVVEVMEYDETKRLFILLAGGSTAGFAKLDPVINWFGKSIGATQASFIGRKGFARTMKKQGWTQPLIYMQKEIV